jgi:hypothetical protein
MATRTPDRSRALAHDSGVGNDGAPLGQPDDFRTGAQPVEADARAAGK